MSDDDEDRDTQRAYRLCEAESRARDTALMRLREAVQNGDLDAMRVAYGGGNGFRIGLEAAYGSPEKMVLTEVLSNSNLSLEILGVFFRELGGRFMVDQKYGVCVFSMLIDIECSTNFHQDEEIERWTVRMAEVVEYLVDELEMPICMRQRYRPRATMSFDGPLFFLAIKYVACACSYAFGQFMRTPPTFVLLEETLVVRLTNAHSSYWVKRLANATEDEDKLWHLSRRTESLPGHITLLNDEGALRKKARELKQALLLLQNRVPENGWACAVMDDINLSHMIMSQAFENARF